ncbi:uncharacterized protein LOC143710324 [Siphateles boraxobius]|uniref:uncharacterized protein LOC143710324 n=1 Tax=Siphateles boraxobius TaxID=180520 RepID=UPI004062E096
MTFLSKVFGCLSFFLPKHHLSRQCSDGNLGCSSIQEEPIQRPPEDTDMEKELDYEDSLVKLEIFPDFSRAAEPLMIPVEEPESQTPHAGVKIFPRSCTVAKPLLIQVAPQHPLPDELETWTSFSTVAEPLMAEKETPPDEVKKSPSSSTKGAETLMVQEAHAEEEILPSFSTVAEPLMAQFEELEKELLSSFTKVAETLMVQEAPWHLTPPSEEQISFSTVAEPLMVQMAPAEEEQERPPERRGRRRTKKERQTYSSTIKLPGATPPAQPKHAWVDVSPAQDTKAEEEMIKKEREAEDKTIVMKMTSVEIVEVDLRQERRMKKERNTELASPPAKAKLAWTEMDGDSAKVTHMKKREDEKRRPERQAKIEDRKTEQAADITPPPAKGKKTDVQEPESSNKTSQKSSRKQKGLLLIYKLAEKKSFEK